MARLKKSDLKKQEYYIRDLILKESGAKVSGNEYDLILLKLATKLIETKYIYNNRKKDFEYFNYDFRIIFNLIKESINRIEHYNTIDPYVYKDVLCNLIEALDNKDSVVNKNRSDKKLVKKLLKYLPHKVNLTKDYTQLVNSLYYFIIDYKDKALFEKLMKEDYTLFNKKDRYGENFVYKVVYYYIKAINKTLATNFKFKDTLDIIYLDNLLAKLKINIEILDEDSKEKINNLISAAKEKALYKSYKEHLEYISILEKRINSHSKRLSVKEKGKIYNLNIYKNYDINPKDLTLTKKAPYKKVDKVKIYTIDSKTDVIKDDAISCRKIGNNYQVAIYIVDPLAYLFNNEKAFDILEGDSEKSALINSVLDQTETIYFRDSEISLFPNEFIDIIKPFEEGNLTHVNSFYFRVNEKGEIFDMDFKKEDIKINKNYTFNEIDEILNGKAEENSKDIFLINKVSSLLAKNNIKAQECFDIKKRGQEILKSERIVENFMLLCNSSVAKYFNEKKLPYIFRNYKIDNRDYTNKKYEYIKELKSGTKPEYNLEIPSKKISKYSNQCIGHEGLNKEAYGHITSPLRRSADLINSIALNNFYYNDYTKEDLNYMNIFNNRISSYINNKKEIMKNNNINVKKINY